MLETARLLAEAQEAVDEHADDIASEPARREVPHRLLRLNRERHTQEEAEAAAAAPVRSAWSSGSGHEGWISPRRTTPS